MLDAVVRHAVYRHFAESGIAPQVAELQDRLEANGARAEAADVTASLERLAEAHHLVLRPGGYDIWMAHPFSGVPTGFPVESGGVRYWANCAWDALGIPALLERDATTELRCAASGEPLHLSVRDGALETDVGVIHFLVPARDFWKDVGFT